MTRNMPGATRQRRSHLIPKIKALCKSQQDAGVLQPGFETLGWAYSGGQL